MSTITIRLNNDEQKAFNEYAKLYNVPLSTLFKKSLEEKIEDEMDMKFIEEYEADIQNGAIELYEHNKVREILGL